MVDPLGHQQRECEELLVAHPQIASLIERVQTITWGTPGKKGGPGPASYDTGRAMIYMAAWLLEGLTDGEQQALVDRRREWLSNYWHNLREREDGNRRYQLTGEKAAVKKATADLLLDIEGLDI
jgi:hypothetical protein